MRLAYLTAGAAGMFCGSCMNDNALARAMIARGDDVVLVPMYTPIRTDAACVSSDRVFLGGINVYLQQKAPWLRHLPSGARRLLDSPTLLRWATRRAASTDARSLGGLTVSMLQGSRGRQRTEIDELVQWLAAELRPDAVLLSNLLIGGCIPALRERLKVPIAVLLQGDDLFLEYLPEPYRAESLELLSGLTRQVDAFLVHSRFYSQRMSELITLPPERTHVVPLAIDATPFADPPQADEEPPRPLRIGYLARLAPEKGLHLLADAFVALARRPSYDAVELHVAGWLGDNHRGYAQKVAAGIAAAGLADRYRYHGSPELAGKVEFLRHIDLLCVPTIYREPKGLFALEAMAAGIPVVVPEHGAFPELIAATGGGVLFPPGDAEALAEVLAELMADAPQRHRLGQQGRQRVLADRSIAAQAERITGLIASLTSAVS